MAELAGAREASTTTTSKMIGGKERKTFLIPIFLHAHLTRTSIVDIYE